MFCLMIAGIPYLSWNPAMSHSNHHAHHSHGGTAGSDIHNAKHDEHDVRLQITGAVWTCPMHPEIRRDAPGSCPKCGMALEPLVADTRSGPSAELVDMTRRFWIGLVLTAPVFFLEMGSHLIPGLHHLVPQSISIWIQLFLATPVVLWCGWPFFARGAASIV